MSRPMVSDLPHDQAGIGAAKPEGVRLHHIDLALLRRIGTEVDRRFSRRVVEVDRRRRDLIAHREDRENRLDRTRRTQKMPGHRLGRGHHQIGRMIAHQPFDGAQFDRIGHGRGAVSIHVIHRRRLQPRTFQGARNAPLFLDMELPENVRIEFRVRSLSDEGDIKFEVFTDGENHESGYIGIFGGWNNSMNIIARLDEHGDDKHIGAEGQAVTRNRIYEMAIVRTDNRLRWYVDGRSFLTYSDDEPLRGEGHEYFALNDWDAPLQFDDVRVYDLGDL